MGRREQRHRASWAIVPRVMIIATMVGGCAGRVSPPGPVMPDRPGYTDTPPALPAGGLQMEAGFTDDRAGGVEYTTIGETLLRVGVGGRSELRFFGNSWATRSMSGSPTVFGREDPKIGVKTNLRTKPDSIHSALPNVAALVAMTLPLGALEFRRIHAQPEAKLAVNWTTASPFSVYSNVGAAGVFDGTSWGKRWWTSVALWYAVNPIVSVYGEGISAAAISGSALPSRDGDVGITFLIDDRLQLDLRAGRGFGRWSATERFFGLGLARRW